MPRRWRSCGGCCASKAPWTEGRHNFRRAANKAAMTGGLDDADLLARGDADAFAEFYGRHARRLAGWLMRATGDAEAAADLTAETFAAALAGRKRYRPDRAAPATWLYGIAAHKLTDWRRRGYAEDRARRRGRRLLRDGPAAGPWGGRVHTV